MQMGARGLDGGDGMDQDGFSRMKDEMRGEGGSRGSQESVKRPKVHTSFRINPVIEVFSKMKGDKEHILKEIGLHGLTSLPKEGPTGNRSFNWQFAFWLLQRLDSQTGSIDLGKRGRLEMRCEDVQLVIGVPSSGAELKKSDKLKLQKTKQVVKEAMLLDPGDDLELENVVKVLEREIKPEEHSVYRRAFIMACYIFAVSYFLAPKGRPAKVNYEILECILDTDAVANINWASYVLMTLREASDKLKRELMAETKSVTLDGCLLLLQIVYLDNLDFGSSTTKHDVLPRVKDFSFQKLDTLINADTRSSAVDVVERFGARQLRDDEDTLYTRGDMYRAILMATRGMASGVILQADKKKILEYIKKNVDEGKRRLQIASRELENVFCTTLDQCHRNISSMLDIYLTGGTVRIGEPSGATNDGGGVMQRNDDMINGELQNGTSVRRRYKTMTRRPRKVRRVELINSANEEHWSTQKGDLHGEEPN